MSRRGLTSALKHHVPPFFSGGRAPNPALQSTNCFLGTLPQFVAREEDGVTGKARICKSDWPDNSIKLTGESFVSCVERKCTSQYRLFENAQRSTEKDVDFSDKPNLFVHRHTTGCDQYFTALSLDEDANLTPKYDIYPPLPPQSQFTFSSSCSGLFCYYDLESRIFLWNPTTNEFKILPQSQSFLETRPGVCVTYEMLGSEIWFDRESDDYKVLRYFDVVLRDEDEEGDYLSSETEFELYSLKSNSWKKIPCPEFLCGGVLPRAFFNGRFYLHATRLEDQTRVFGSLDLSTETFSTLPLPDVDDPDFFYPLEYNGLLSCLLRTTNEIGKSYELWVMMNGSWTRESVFHTCGVMMPPIRFWSYGKLWFLESSNHELVLFDRGTGKLKHLGVSSSPYTRQLFVPFYESFAQLKVEVQEQEKEEDGRMIEAEYGPLIAA